MKKPVLIITGLIAVLLTGTAYAVVRRERNRPFVDRVANHLSRRLDLTDTQKAQVKTILEAERSKVAPLLAEAGKNRQQLHDSTANGKFDEAQVRAIAAEQAKTMTELMVEKERVKAKIYNEVLTPEQRTKADTMLERMQSHFRGRMHGRFDENAPERP